MNLREYQAKKIFSDHGIPIPPGRIAKSSEEVNNIAVELNCPVVLKPQLGIKKRGKLGIIKFADSPEVAAKEAERLFTLSVKGEPVKIILVEVKADIARELYLAVTVDYSRRCPTIIVSQLGGVDIEELAKNEPQHLLKLPVNILNGVTEKNLVRLKEFIGSEVTQYAQKLYTIFRKYDAEMVEINPLVQIKAKEFLAVDGVLNINSDSLFRHPELETFRREIGDIDPIAEQANANNWTYIDLPGDIAILSSGAGLTMTILDLINFSGGAAANFLDTAQIDENGIYKAFELLAKAKEAKVMLVNIFAGLNRCDMLAQGIRRYIEEHPLDIPVVIRMIGNKEDIGHRILREIGIEPFTNLEQAVDRVVELSKNSLLN